MYMWYISYEYDEPEDARYREPVSRPRRDVRPPFSTQSTLI
jgi:hypothetical protein